jgi:peptidoglycan/LPS O-acetylase OafA/YrhL
MKVIGDISSAGNNSFGLVRLLAAMSVVISHGWVVTGGAHAIEPLEAYTGYPLGAHAVHVFFTVSGLLVAASFDRRPSIAAFGAARFFRIYPGLLAATIGVFLVCAFVASNAGFADIIKGSIIGYFAKTLIGLAGSGAIPGVFESLPYAGGVNVPLWTLKYEVLCYISLALIMALIARTRLVSPLVAAGGIIAVSGAWLLQGKAYDDANFFDHIARFSFAFWVGVAAWHLRSRIPLRVVILAALLALSVCSIYFQLPTVPHTLMLLSGYLAVFVAQYRYGALSAFTDSNDLSYGVYIYGWPVQQMLLMAVPAISGLANGLAALLLVLPLSYLSWRFIEKPALRLKDGFMVNTKHETILKQPAEGF